MDLKTALPILLPKAVQWAEEQERDILAAGRTLTTEEIGTARAVGVIQPENIRIKSVPNIPMPKEPMLADAAIEVGFIGSNMVGLTLFYGIFICAGTYSRTLLAHECRHVYQYEQRGSILAFLQEYIPQMITSDYVNAPLEKDARDAAARYELMLATEKVSF